MSTFAQYDKDGKFLGVGEGTISQDPNYLRCHYCGKIMLDKPFDQCDSVTQMNWHLYCKCKTQTKGAETDAAKPHQP